MSKEETTLSITENTEEFSERRRHERFAELLSKEERVLIKTKAGYFAAKLIDLSMGGAQLEVRNKVDSIIAAQSVGLLFSSGTAVMTLNGKYVRTEGTKVAFEFVAITPIEAKEIQKKLIIMQMLSSRILSSSPPQV